MKTIKELEKEIEEFDKAYKDWNNKKLSGEERERAQRIVDKRTDDYTDSGINEIILNLFSSHWIERDKK